LKRREITIGEPTQTDLAYLAGLIDGEGHVSIHPKKAIVLCMTDIPLLDWCHAKFSGTMSGNWINEKNASARPRKMWHLSRIADLAYVLPLLDPYLVLKRAECDALRRLALHSLSPDGFATGGSRGHGRTQEWRDRRDAIVAEGRAAFEARRR
jgi:hypothetical protein